MLIISECLAGEPCRYDGKHNRVESIVSLMKDRPYVLACPEVLGGLPTPRTPCEIMGDRVISKSGEDCTEAFNKGASMTMALCKAHQVTTAILKAKSPSCGLNQVYDGTFSKTLIKGDGLTARLLKQGGIRVLDESMNIGLHILVAYEVTQAQKEKMVGYFPEHYFEFILSRDATLEDLQKADVIFGNPRSGQLKHCTKLKWLQLESAGFERYTAAGVCPPSVTLTNARGCYGPAVSEHMFATTMMLLKKLHLYRDLQRTSQWKDMGQVKSLKNALVLVVGAGDIGQHYSRAVRQMGAQTIGLRRSKPEVSQVATQFANLSSNLWLDAHDDFDGVGQIKDFKELAVHADVIALCAPDNADSQNLMNKELLLTLKEDVLIINAGRGSAINQEDLMFVLDSGKKLSVALDVTVPEPLPEEHPLWQYPDVFISPHISGGSHLPETFERLVALSIKNLDAFTRGGQLENIIIKGEIPDGAESLK